MSTGYYIASNCIYGPNGSTGCYIDPAGYIRGKVSNSGTYYIISGIIHKSGEGSTGFYISGNLILGPTQKMPFL